MSVTGFPDLSYMQVFLHNLCIHWAKLFHIGTIDDITISLRPALHRTNCPGEPPSTILLPHTATWCCIHAILVMDAINIKHLTLWKNYCEQTNHHTVKLHSHQTSSQKNIKPWRSWPLNGEIYWWNHSWFTAQTSNKCNFNIHYSCRLLLHIITNNEKRQSMPQTSLVKIQTSHPSSLTGQRQINRHNLQNQAVFWVWGKKGRV